MTSWQFSLWGADNIYVNKIKSKYQIWELIVGSYFKLSLWFRNYRLGVSSTSTSRPTPCIRLNRGWDSSLDIFGIGVFAHLYLLNDTTSPVQGPRSQVQVVWCVVWIPSEVPLLSRDLSPASNNKPPTPALVTWPGQGAAGGSSVKYRSYEATLDRAHSMIQWWIYSQTRTGDIPTIRPTTWTWLTLFC